MCTHARYCYWWAGPLIFIQLVVAYHRYIKKLKRPACSANFGLHNDIKKRDFAKVCEMGGLCIHGHIYIYNFIGRVGAIPAGRTNSMIFLYIILYIIFISVSYVVP